MTDESIPDWVTSFATEIAQFIRDMERFDLHWTPPEESDSGVDHIELAPSIVKMKVAGPQAGTPGTLVITHIDLLEVQKVFTQVDSFSFDNVYLPRQERGKFNLSPSLQFSGEKDGRPVSVEVFFEPFDDAEMVYDRSILIHKENNP
jgi:hypothetical protein